MTDKDKAINKIRAALDDVNDFERLMTGQFKPQGWVLNDFIDQVHIDTIRAVLKTALEQLEDDGELKACPFCGCDEIDLEYVGEIDRPQEHDEDWNCTCWHCGASPISDPLTKSGATDEWNNRAADKKLIESIIRQTA